MNAKIIQDIAREEELKKYEQEFLKAKKVTLKLGWNYTKFKKSPMMRKFMKERGNIKNETMWIEEYKDFCEFNLHLKGGLPEYVKMAKLASKNN